MSFQQLRIITEPFRTNFLNRNLDWFGKMKIWLIYTLSAVKNTELL